MKLHPLIIRFLVRHEPRRDWRVLWKSALATTVTVTLIGALSVWTGLHLLIAPLGPTALLVFGQPDSAGAQPINVFAGYFIGTVIAALALMIVPEPWWLATMGVGAAMLIMLVLRVTHPPAAAVPLLILSGPIEPLRLFGVLLVACTMVVLLAIVIHRLPPRHRYPLPLKDEIDQE